MRFGLWEQAMAGTEPLKKDRNGRITKLDHHRWTKEWLSENLLAKGGNHTAKAVIAGDPSLSIEEIGVPWAIAQKLTLPESATTLNCAKLQEYVNRSQALDTGSGKPGATRFERNGEAFEVFPNSKHEVQIGDVIHRNIRDGDYVYVNRPPSVHKHSLMAFKVHIHHGLVITVNPLVCAPFGADFDGDIFHIFIPQSLQAIAEVKLLMAVPQQLVSDYGGQPLLGLTQVIDLQVQLDLHLHFQWVDINV
jgi:DNA-directed RNA polymerase beta' subunit